MENESYETITNEESNFIIELYEAIRWRVVDGKVVTLVGLSKELNVTPSELAEYLPTILTILTKVEDEVRQRRGRD